MKMKEIQRKPKAISRTERDYQERHKLRKLQKQTDTGESDEDQCYYECKVDKPTPSEIGT